MNKFEQERQVKHQIELCKKIDSILQKNGINYFAIKMDINAENYNFLQAGLICSLHLWPTTNDISITVFSEHFAMYYFVDAEKSEMSRRYYRRVDFDMELPKLS